MGKRNDRARKHARWMDAMERRHDRHSIDPEHQEDHLDSRLGLNRGAARERARLFLTHTLESDEIEEIL